MPTREAIPARNGSRKGSSAEVTASVIPVAVTSVLPVTRPSPGKCFTVATTPPSCKPVMIAGTAAETAAGSVPNSRRYLPIGPLVSSMDCGTVSATGARSTLTPAASSSRARVDPRATSSERLRRPCSRAAGSAVNPVPLSCWTAPPSWSAATKRSTGPVATRCTWSEVALTVAAPVQPPR